MKRILSILFVVVALASCGTTKHTVKHARCVSADSMVTQAKANTHVERFVDTTRFENGKVTITEIDFFDDAPGFVPDTAAHGDVVKHRGTSATLPKVGSFTGVKKMKQTTIERDVVQKGESWQNEESQSSSYQANNRREESAVEVEAQPAPDPYKWRYIFYLSVVLLIVLLMLKRSKVANAFWKIVGYLKRKF